MLNQPLWRHVIKVYNNSLPPNGLTQKLIHIFLVTKSSLQDTVIFIFYNVIVDLALTNPQNEET